MVDQTPDATTYDPMTLDTTTAVGTATVPPMAPSESKPPQAPVPPPPVTAAIDEALRWLASVVVMAGPPDEIDVSKTTRQIDVATPNQQLFTRWQAIIGAVAQPTRPDALGATVYATTMYPGLWSVTIHAHVTTNGVTTQ